MDYGALPPEINSGRIYAGSGSAPMMAAAAAWRRMAAELTSAAASYTAVVSQLTDEEWVGPAAAAMAAAIRPHVEWMSGTGALAEHAANQASAAAAAFNTTYSATVPPPVIAANRAQLAMLLATNVLGINTAAIAANEATYAEMWAQDAAAMYGYANASAAAATVTPFTEPHEIVNPAGLGGQAAAVSQASGTAAGNTVQTVQAISALPNAIQSLSAPITAASSVASGTPAGMINSLNGVLNNMPLNGALYLIGNPIYNGMNAMTSAAAYIPSSLAPSMVGYLSQGGNLAAASGSSLGGLGGGLGALLTPSGPIGSLGALGGSAASAASGVSWAAPAVSADVGHASMVSNLSVPQSWTSATLAPVSAGLIQASGSSPTPANHVVAVPPPAAVTGNRRGGFGFGMPRYGFKPTVMARPIVAG